MPKFVVTGGAGFIGSHVVRALIARGNAVTVVDDFSTGKRENLAGMAPLVELLEGSIEDRPLLARAMQHADYCLHQAAIPSVPRSVADPWASNRANIEGTLNVFVAARDAGVKRVVFASSSSIYGNTDQVPVSESLPRAPISPYGVTKATDELYGDVFAGLYGLDVVALRYFNVFGPRQAPDSAYAAVVPIFLSHMLRGERPPVHGHGHQARDFTFVDNVVQANLRACQAEERIAGAYNIACGASTSVVELVAALNALLGTNLPPDHQPARAGDILRSWADISKARKAFGYSPMVTLTEGLEKTIAWFREQELSA